MNENQSDNNQNQTENQDQSDNNQNQTGNQDQSDNNQNQTGNQDQSDNNQNQTGNENSGVPTPPPDQLHHLTHSMRLPTLEDFCFVNTFKQEGTRFLYTVKTNFHNYESYLRFDIDSYQKSISENSVKFVFWYVNNIEVGTDPYTYENYPFRIAFSHDQTWSVANVNSANRPSKDLILNEIIFMNDLVTLDEKNITIGPSNDLKTYRAVKKELDIGDLAQHVLETDSFLTLILYTDVLNTAITFLSQEAVGYPPYLLFDHDVTFNLTNPSFFNKPLANHPRVWANQDDFERVKNLKDVDPILASRYNMIKNQGDAYLLEQPDAFLTTTVGEPDRETNFEVRKRAEVLSLLYLVENDPAYAEHLWLILEEAKKDHARTWKKDHFLDVAEMSAGYAVAYDWLYPYWTENRRETIRNTLWTKGVSKGLDAYRGELLASTWLKAKHNWGMVCHGGLGMAALALGQDDFSIAADVEQTFKHAKRSIDSYIVNQFAPDGGWFEGPSYSAYVDQFFTRFYRTAEKALGTNFQIFDAPGVAQRTTFAQHMESPNVGAFNFSDAFVDPTSIGDLYYHAYHYQDEPVIDFLNARTNDIRIPHVLFYERPAQAYGAVPTGYHFQGIKTATIRSSWSDVKATFLGVTAINNDAADHGDLQIGSFVLDALGGRWIHEYGRDDYGLSNYFVVSTSSTPNRWHYYRKRAEGHNTLVMNPTSGVDQALTAAGQITQFNLTGDPFIILDLTQAYQTHASSVLRGLKLLNNRDVLLQDEVTLINSNNTLHSFFQLKVGDHNGYQFTAALQDADRSALLTQEVRVPNGVGGTTVENMNLIIRLIEPVGATFALGAAAPLPSSPNPVGQDANSGYNRLSIDLTSLATGSHRIALAFLPFENGDPVPNPTIVLDDLTNW